MSKEIDPRVAEHMRRADEHAEQEARKQSLGRIVGGLYADAGVNVRALSEGEFERSREAFGTALAAAHEQVEALKAERERLREALEEARLHHEVESKALSKQPPAGDRNWRRLRHREEIERIDAALRTTDEGEGS